MNDSEEKAAESKTLDPERDIDVAWARLELDKERLKLDIERHETSKQLDRDRIVLEKAKERTAKLQLITPVLVSIFAIGLSLWTAILQYRLQYAQAVSSYNSTRLELFKELARRANDPAGVQQAYKETFPNDWKTLEGEQMGQKARDK